jgi:two-component system, OmpR family, sensor histidine kinase ChvG
MSLRTKLLLLSLLTLILPWAGWQYAQQMETTLREAQEQALLTTAQVLSRVVASQPEELYRVSELRTRFDAAKGDWFAPLLPTQPLIDGFADEWPEPSRFIPGLDRKSPRVRLGVYGRFMHVYVDVEDVQMRYETPAGEDATEPSPSDRVVFFTRDEYGRERAWSVSAAAPGPAIVRTADIGSPWRSTMDQVPYVSGIWRATNTGYAIELRAPLSIFGTQLAIFAIDLNNKITAASTSPGWLHVGSESLKQRLTQYAPAALRVSVVDANGWLLARAGSIAVDVQSSYPGLRTNDEGFSRSIYRALFGGSERPGQSYGLPYGMWGEPVDAARKGKNLAIWFDQSGGEPSVVRAAVPIEVGNTVLGALIVEEPGERLVLVREMALTRLLNLTLVATLFSIIITLVFAARLSHRIRRLSRAASTALTPEGRIEANIPEVRARDELGALARNYSTLLARLKEYTSYLQTLGTKLSHELRTPLTIVSSSLENLGSEVQLHGNSADYLERARSGTNRMHAILTAMTEATRVEQSIEHTDRIQFDLTELVRNIGLAYRQSFAGHRIETLVPEQPCLIEGSPDLIVQMLDKLMDNAADFCPEGGQIAIALRTDDRTCRLSVANAGSRLPPQLDGRLFESLVSHRPAAESKPHLGLGLFIVRLIADFHHAAVTATNLPDEAGVEFIVELPIAAASKASS